MAKFINPYGFVPLSDKKREITNEEGHYTGYIKYQIKTKSSIFIPNVTSERAFKYEPTQNDKKEADDPENKHILQDFFSITDLDPKKEYDNEYFEPQIPGSEIRGVIRSIYETLTASCFSQANKDVVIGKRTVEHFLPGVLRRNNNKYTLYEAEDTLYRDNKDFSVHKFSDAKLSKDGLEVKVHLSKGKNYEKSKVTSLNGNIKGYLIKGNIGPELAPNQYIKDNRCPKCIMNDSCKQERCWSAEKHCAHVFVERKNAQNHFVTAKEIENLGYVIEQYKKENEKAYEEYGETYKEFCDKKIHSLPVYYSLLDSGYVMLSPACITREVYNNTEKSALQAFNKCTPNSKDANMCPACSLFGLINSEGFSMGSRVRFSDLRLKDLESYNDKYKDCYDDELYIMPELASPKLSNSEFYLEKPNDPDGEVWFWTYDYYTVKKNGEVVVKVYETDKFPKLSGRKYYWHGHKITGYKHKTKRNKTVRTVKEGICFEGKLFFDNITKLQLDQLIYIMNYTKNEEHGYKIGSGKPVGLGSTCFSVIEVMRRTYDNTYEEKNYPIVDSKWEDLQFDKEIKASFNSITSFLSDEDAKRVHYPGVYAEGDEGFDWFVKNRVNYKINKAVIDNAPKKRIQTKICQSLSRPDIGKYLKDNSGDNNKRENYEDNRKVYNNNNNKNKNLKDSSNNNRKLPDNNKNKCKVPGCKNMTRMRNDGKPHAYCYNHKDYATRKLSF